MNKCMYCGKVAPKMSLICDACANALVEIPEKPEPKYCWPLLPGCNCGCKTE